MAPSAEPQAAQARRGLTLDQALALAALVALTAIAWAWLVVDGRSVAGPGTTGMAGMAMPAAAHASLGAYVPLAAMWTVMMAAMMLPSATPMILFYAGQARRRGAGGLAATSLFVGGYGLVWTGFALAAAALQLWLNSAAFVTPQMTLASRPVAAALLIGAGAYELSPLKQTCLAHCQSPFAFVAAHWRPGLSGALRMGATHGLFCLGCCWALMLLLFAGGVMNLLWVAALAAVALLQKALPPNAWTTRLTGAAAIAAGGGLLVPGLLR